MSKNSDPELDQLPKGWPKVVKSAVLHAISLAQYALTWTRANCANSRITRVRLKTNLDQAEQEIALLHEELCLKDARFSRIPARKRPRYRKTERMAILELRAARGWSNAQTARRLILAESETIASWTKSTRVEGHSPPVETPEPVNKYPAFVRHIVQRLKALCPTMGKKRIAQLLARAGLHLGTTTVGRMLKEKYKTRQNIKAKGEVPDSKGSDPRVVTAKYPNHVWHVDLTTVPVLLGFWTPWIPFSLPQTWPSCWWVAVVFDHYSRRIQGVTLFKKEPTSIEIRSFLGRTIQQVAQAPKHIVSDQGGQFDCPGYRGWCKRRGIKFRYGAVGQYGSIAVIERLIRTLKEEGTRRFLISMRRDDMRKELTLFIDWFNGHRPHQRLSGRTPEEMYRDTPPANEAPRFEPRRKWPRSSVSASPQARTNGRCGVRLELVVSYFENRKHLPLVQLKKAA